MACLALLPALPSPIQQLAQWLGPNGLPYALPIHPNLVHFTIGLFVIAIAFDVAGPCIRSSGGCSGFLHCRSPGRASTTWVGTTCSPARW